ncbi:MAG: hypothetical protein EAZ43_04065 [Betaproteobacteria bacterium]|nr:MAG: hypothetical protein EAZ43_04065 [Betaproteobacteria bacterium]
MIFATHAADFAVSRSLLPCITKAAWSFINRRLPTSDLRKSVSKKARNDLFQAITLATGCAAEAR